MEKDCIKLLTFGNQQSKIREKEVMEIKKYNIYCNGHYWYGNDDILRVVRECRNMVASGVERDAIKILEKMNTIKLSF